MPNAPVSTNARTDAAANFSRLTIEVERLRKNKQGGWNYRANAEITVVEKVTPPFRGVARNGARLDLITDPDGAYFSTARVVGSRAASPSASAAMAPRFEVAAPRPLAGTGFPPEYRGRDSADRSSE